MYDIVAIGESLIDFTPSGINEQGAMLFSRNPGGAPSNVLVANSALGGTGAFIGMVGEDMFGDFLIETLKTYNVATEGVVRSKETNTTLAFVQLDETGDRSFSFYRNPGADMMLRDEDVSEALLSSCKIFHFGSVSLTDEPSRSANFNAVQKAKEYGAIISYDPNYRPLLWKTEEEARVQMLKGLDYADIVKLSEEELFLLTGEEDMAAATKLIQEKGAALVLVSLGKAGAYCRYQDICKSYPTFDVPVVDTTSAGDAFLGAILNKLKDVTKDALNQLEEAFLDELMAYGNACGALTTTKKGAINAIPNKDELETLLAQSKAGKVGFVQA